MKFDFYTFYSRFIPAAITIIPLILFNHFYINPELSGFIHTVYDWKWIGTLTTSLILIIVFAKINRIISRLFFESRIYKNELYMPTTNLLLYSDESFTGSYKDKIRDKVYRDFGYKLPSKREESDDEQECRKRIIEAVVSIREKIRDGRLVSQHNREYGFIRNLIGGSVVGATLTLFNVIFFKVYFPSPLAVTLSIFGLIAYSLILLLHKPILDMHARQYAKKLIHEYMNN
jgi:hypothetical protein